VVSCHEDSDTVTVLWDHGTVQTYTVQKGGGALHLLAPVERHHSQRAVVLLRAALRLFERSLKQAAQESSWGQVRVPNSVHVQPGEAHMAPFISPTSVAAPRTEWHARVAACRSPRDFKALVLALEDSFLPSAVSLPWGATLRGVWAKFDPLHHTEHDEPGAPSVLRRLATWLQGLTCAFSAPLLVPEWDIQALPAFDAAVDMVGGVHFPFISPNRHHQLQLVLRAARELEVMLAQRSLPRATNEAEAGMHARRHKLHKALMQSPDLASGVHHLGALGRLLLDLGADVTYPDWAEYRHNSWRMHHMLLLDAVHAAMRSMGPPELVVAQELTNLRSGRAAQPLSPVHEERKAYQEHHGNRGGLSRKNSMNRMSDQARLAWEATPPSAAGASGSGSDDQRLQLAVKMDAAQGALDSGKYTNAEHNALYYSLITEAASVLLTLAGEAVETEAWHDAWVPIFDRMDACVHHLQVPVFTTHLPSDLVAHCPSEDAWACDVAECTLRFSGFSMDHFRSLGPVASNGRHFHICRACLAGRNNITIGDRVVRRAADWEHGDIDGGLGGYGIVTHVFGLTEQEPNIGNVTVHWDCDAAASDVPMRMGAGGFRDLVVISFPTGTHVQLMEKPGRINALIKAFSGPPARLPVANTAPGDGSQEGAASAAGMALGQGAGLVATSRGANGATVRNPAAYMGAHNASFGFGPMVPLSYAPVLEKQTPLHKVSIAKLVGKQGKVLSTSYSPHERSPPCTLVKFDNVAQSVWLPTAVLKLDSKPDWATLEG